MNLDDVKRRVFVNCPFDLLVETYLDSIIANRVNPEIGLNGDVLDRFRRPTFRKISQILKNEGLKCTIHGPFTDLSLGAMDPRVRKITIERFKQAIDIATLMKAASVVLHTGFDQRHYYGIEDRWMNHAAESLHILAEHADARGPSIMLENVFELTPAVHRYLLDHAPGCAAGFCLDLGHQEIFSRTGVEKWLEELGDRLGQLHLHDNMGIHDDHLAIGEGKLDFDGLFRWLMENGKNPILTLEPHGLDAVTPSLEGLAKLIERFPPASGKSA